MFTKQNNMQVSNSLINAICYVLVFICSMRLLLPSVYGFACFGFILLYIYFFNIDRRKANTFCVMAIFTLVDNGGGTYQETPAVLRYLCYSLAIAPYFFNKFNLLRVCGYVLMLIFFGVCTILYSGEIDTSTLTRDVFLIFLFGLVFCSKITYAHKLDYTFLSIMIGMYSLFEIVNYSLYNPNTDYLNYDSTKALVVICSIYFLTTKVKNSFFVYLSIFLTLLLLGLYVTRMILVAYICVLIYLIIKKHVNIYLVLATFLLYLLFSFFILDFDFGKVKLIYTAKLLFQEGISIESLMFLDPVRYYESKAYFDSGLGVFTGNGLGSGFKDNEGYFDFINIYDTAFSEDELKSKVFYNFHDVWVDIGYRFGLFFLVLIYVPVFRGVASHNSEKALYASVLFILLTCSFYSMAGLILCALFYSAFLACDSNAKVEARC